MKVLIRADASLRLGSGHVMRCLTLADRLQKKGCHITFICRKLQGDLIELIRKKGFKVFELKLSESVLKAYSDESAFLENLRNDWENDFEECQRLLTSCNDSFEWLIVDHYGLDKSWEARMRTLFRKIMVIDDLADQYHDADLLLNQNCLSNIALKYLPRVSSSCQKLLGPHYALLRDEFLKAGKEKRIHSGEIKRIFIFFGGTDPTNETGKVLEAIKKSGLNHLSVDVVVREGNPHKQVINKLSDEMTNTTFYCEVNNIAELMVKADLAIGAAGGHLFERCFLGLPAIVISIAENQVEIARNVHKKGAIIYLGKSNETKADDICLTLKSLCNNKTEVTSMSKIAKTLVDGQGTERVVNSIFQFL